MLESPLYVRADAEIYRYYAAQGVEMLDDISAYDGVHGLFLHGYRNNRKGIKPFIKVGYHEGLIDSETWLAVQDKKSHHRKIPSNGTSVNSWLTGLVKCAHCGYSPFIVSSWNTKHTRQYRYYHDNGYRRFGGCLRQTWKTRPDDVEQAVFEAMKERIKTLEIAKKKRAKPSAEVEKINAELAACDEEIRDLMAKLPKADNVLFGYIQSRIAELHEKKTALEKKLNQRRRKQKEVDTKPLSEPLKKWDSLSLEEKREVAATMIEVVRVSDENGIEIEFSI